ncbi:hypothetical protein C2869_09425 [Saccharobesus litoralis]|uniref:RanBP2-type domain-containing protein n=1 Tax=Saccharobesus litoralis TaxID=2172099 RepID=A0A2S0VQZ4_9ALTE|nr:DUF2007 domain-containing protein [Saccharobesus litoralis]AWB66637.1 hypothetical protein C2869_09425 [Saccharobesus litoralis]
MHNANLNNIPDTWVVAYRAADQIQANCLVGLLKHHGINAHLRGESLSGAVGELPMDALQVEIMVDKADFVKARHIAMEADSAVLEDDWICVKCKETNAATFDLCWQCGHDPQNDRE